MTVDHDHPTDRPPDSLREEAAVWFVRMRGENAPGHQPAFDAWLARGALHRAAYNRIAETFAAGRVLKSEPLSSSQSGLAFKRWLAPAGALMTAVIILVAHYKPLLPRQALQVAEPSLDEGMRPVRIRRSTFRLPLEGRVILDTDGQIFANLSGDPTSSRLERGRARFSFVPRSTVRRIFAGGLQVRSRGGTFDLWLRPDGALDAQIISGAVGVVPAVAMMPAGGRRPMWLVEGQHYRFDAHGRGVRLGRAFGLDWPQGVLEYRGVPLDDVLEEANRYSSVKLVLADRGLGYRRVSGRFRVEDPKRLAARLADALSLAFDTPQPGFVVLRARKKSAQGPRV